jgi:hypothetical protein
VRAVAAALGVSMTTLQRWTRGAARRSGFRPVNVVNRTPSVGGGTAVVGSSEIGYSPRVRGLRGAGSRSALPLRFSVIFEYGGLIP